MRSTRAVVLLVCALSISGCKKHGEVAGGGEAGGAEAAADDSGTDAADAAVITSEAGLEDAAAAPADAAPEAAPDTLTSNSSFAGAFECFGGSLTLVQTGSQITGNAYAHAGSATQTTEVLCTIEGRRCVGQASYFSQKGDHTPKPAGKGKLILTAEKGGLRYTTTHGGTQEGFCPRKEVNTPAGDRSDIAVILGAEGPKDRTDIRGFPASI
jgi:hypothetical protein